MTTIGFNNRWIRLVKDLLFVGLCIWLLTRQSFFAGVFGILGLFWYGRDAWFQIKALWQEKHFVPKSDASRPGPTTTAPEDGKITVTNLSDAKEVDFEKE